MLTAKAFDRAAQLFQKHWERWDGGEKTWEWTKMPRQTMFKTSDHSAKGVLRMRRVQRWAGSEPEEQDGRGEKVEEPWVEEHEDEATAKLPPIQDEHVSQVWEFCIVYNEVYRVPCLMVDPRREGELIGVNEAFQHLTRLPRAQFASLGISGNVTMEEHPITGVPCYALHPCRTADALHVILGVHDGGRESSSPADFHQTQHRTRFELDDHASASDLLKYMIAFYSVIQDIVGLVSTSNLNQRLHLDQKIL